MMKLLLAVALSCLVLSAQKTPPEVLHKVEPAYSEEAREARWAGTIVASITIDEMGTVTNVEVSEHPGMGMDKQVAEAVRQWKFKPAQQDGKTIPFQATVKFNFELQ